MSNLATLGPIGTRRKPPAKDKAMQFSLYLPRDLMQRLDAWRFSQHTPPARIAVIRQIIINFLNDEETCV